MPVSAAVGLLRQAGGEGRCSYYHHYYRFYICLFSNWPAVRWRWCDIGRAAVRLFMLDCVIKTNVSGCDVYL